MPAIHLHEVRKTFPNGSVGLHATTLSILDQSYFVLLGKSGSGKSTLLRLIAGLETTDAGTIRFNDRPVDRLQPHERNLAFVPQRSTLYPERNVAQNIRIALEFGSSRNRPANAEIDKRTQDAAELLGIHDLLARRPHELSGGEQRRVALARALVRRTPIWLLDEPLSQLDAPLAEKLSRDLHLIQRRFALTIVHVTHDPNEAMALADRVGLLGEGRILQSGKPEEVYSRPGNRTVGLHFGRPVINLIDGEAQNGWFAAGGLRVECPHSGRLTLGIRPEDVGFANAEGRTRIGESDVRTNQRLDRRILVTTADTMRGIANEPMDGPAEIWVRYDRIHWFDADTGERIERTLET